MTETYKPWGLSPEQLADQMRGRRFGELVLHHIKKQSDSQIVAALSHTVSFLPAPLQTASADWIDINNPDGINSSFWQMDCGDAVLLITKRAAEFASELGVRPDDDMLLNLFQIIVLNFAYTANSEPKSKAFIQKSLGFGLLRRMFG